MSYPPRMCVAVSNSASRRSATANAHPWHGCSPATPSSTAPRHNSTATAPGTSASPPVGTVADDEIWQAEEGDFTPYRRRIDYLAATSVPLADLRPRLHLTENPNWGYQLRCGFVSLDAHDVQIIEEAMCA